MKHISKLILCSSLVFLTSCDNVHDAEEVSVKEFEWTIQEEIVDQWKYITFNFTNNSEYKITSMELILSPNNKMTKKVLNDFYEFYQEEYNLTDKEMVYTKLNGVLTLECSISHSVPSGQTIENEICTYNGTKYARNIKYAKYFKEDSIRYSYLKGDMIYRTCYDFDSKSYSHEEPEPAIKVPIVLG